MKDIFAEFGIPDKVISDNGPHYSSHMFRTFAKDWGFIHTTSSPHRPQGNGFIERQVQTIKQLQKKSSSSDTDFQLALLHWRATPVSAKIPSPAQMLMGRRIKSTIISKVENSLPEKEEIRNQLIQRQQAQKMHFDRHALKHDLPPLYSGQQVRVQHPTSGCWEPAVIKCTTDDPRSYIVQQANGQVIRRNRQHIRETPIAMPDARSTAILPSVPATDAEPPRPETDQTEVRPPTTPSGEAGNTEGIRTRSGRTVRPPQRFANL